MSLIKTVVILFDLSLLCDMRSLLLSHEFPFDNRSNVQADILRLNDHHKF